MKVCIFQCVPLLICLQRTEGQIAQIQEYLRINILGGGIGIESPRIMEM